MPQGSRTVLANELRMLADEQTALRRVAELVARGAGPDEVFARVAAELRKLVGGTATMYRYDGELNTCVAAWHETGESDLVGTSEVAAEGSLLAQIRRTGLPGRVDNYPWLPGASGESTPGLGARAVAGGPITVQDRPWGVLSVVFDGPERPPRDIELRIARFGELVSTAIANAQARSELEQLLDEQAALRRVATLVARRGSPQDVFEAVTLEASRLLGDKSTALLRYEPEGDAVLVAVRRGGARIGMRVPAEGDSLTARVARTGRPARIDTYEGVAGVEVAREVGVGAAVAAPIVVEDRLWGLILAMTRASPLPAGTENRLAQFAELVAAAIGNAESRAELSASRARIVAAGDEARRRIQRDLHDGAQQRLVHTIMTLKLAKAALGDETGPVADFLHESLEQAERANAELRELVHGILPASLSRGGLRAGIGSLIGRIGLPVSADVAVGRLSRSLETTAYFIVAEALTNVVKHARATSARVSVAVAGGALRLEVSDDGAGGADRSRGTGLLGLADRVGASGGTISLTSPPGEGTTLVVLLPLDDGEARPTALPPTSRS